jgi:orotidine-5'-phosphate decarboxylase
MSPILVALDVATGAQAIVLADACRGSVGGFKIGRPAGQAGNDDQARTLGPREAIDAGADYLVIGRPITTAANPRAAANQITSEIAGVPTR